jgi:hypothetical protein
MTKAVAWFANPDERLTHGPVSMATRKFVRGLSEHDRISLYHNCGATTPLSLAPVAAGADRTERALGAAAEGLKPRRGPGPAPGSAGRRH